MRSPLVLLSLSALAACGNKAASMCEPFKSVGLPGVTRIDRCEAKDISGETTATPADFVAKFQAAGYEVGRDVNEPKYAGDWFILKKGDDYLRLTSTFEGSEKRKHPFFMISKADPRKWIAEERYQFLLAAPAKRDELLAKLRSAADVFTATAKAPKACPPLAALDPLATPPGGFLLNLDSADLAGKNHRWARGPELFTVLPPSDVEQFETTAKRADEVAAIAKRRVVPVMRVTAYKAPVVPRDNVFGTFTPGTASFEVGFVDLEEKRVLCRSKGRAQSSEVIEATTYTEKYRDGSVGNQYTVAGEHRDLADNMAKAAFAELGRMTTQLAQQ